MPHCYVVYTACEDLQHVRVTVCSVAPRAVSFMCAYCCYATCIGDSGGEAVRCTSLFARTCVIQVWQHQMKIDASRVQNSVVSNTL
jgi:hypothetical protein